MVTVFLHGFSGDRRGFGSEGLQEAGLQDEWSVLFRWDGFEAFDDVGPAVRACDLQSFVLLLWFLLAGHGSTE